jgi:hypothetical protein
MALSQAEKELRDWGAVFPELADYPGRDTRVWLVDILGMGVEPRAPGAGASATKCLEIRVIVTEAPKEELALFGRPATGCGP